MSLLNKERPMGSEKPCAVQHIIFKQSNIMEQEEQR